MLVMGTALMVSPFNMLVEMAPKTAHQVLINRENTAAVYDFTAGNNRLFLPGNCDDTVLKIVRECGWDEEFLRILKGYEGKQPVGGSGSGSGSGNDGGSGAAD